MIIIFLGVTFWIIEGLFRSNVIEVFFFFCISEGLDRRVQTRQ